MFEFMSNMSNNFSNLREEFRQDASEVRAQITILREEFVAASPARSESLPLPSQSGPTGHSQHLRAMNDNGRQPLQAAGGAPYPDPYDSDEDENVIPNPVDQPYLYISDSSSATSAPQITSPVASGPCENGGGGDDSSDDPNGNDDFHSVDSDEDISSPNTHPDDVPPKSSGSSESGPPDSPSHPKRTYIGALCTYADVAHPHS